MKKTLLIVTLVILALGALGIGVVAAQDEQPPFGGRGYMDGTGSLHEYMQKAMADAVGLSESAFKARHDAGETFYQIALAEGFTAEEIPSLMLTAREKALDAAAKDGVITQEQADWMKSRGYGRGGMMYGGGYNGAEGCPMYSGEGAVPQGQFGGGFGRGGGMRNWSGQY